MVSKAVKKKINRKHGALGGAAGTGKSKMRGTPQDYRNMALKRWRKHRRILKLARAAGIATCLLLLTGCVHGMLSNSGNHCDPYRHNSVDSYRGVYGTEGLDCYRGSRSNCSF